MFWKKLASRADETPTFELSFSGHELVGQKNIYQKHKVFQMFFLPVKIHVTIWVPRRPEKSRNLKFS